MVKFFPRLFELVDIFRNTGRIVVVTNHLCRKNDEFGCVQTATVGFQVFQERNSCDIVVKCPWVAEVLVMHLVDCFTDEFSGAAFCSHVRGIVTELLCMDCFATAANHSCGIVSNCQAVGGRTCWLHEGLSPGSRVCCNSFNEADKVVGSGHVIINVM